MSTNYLDEQVRERTRTAAFFLGEPAATELRTALDAIDYLQTRLLLTQRVVAAARELQEEVRASEWGPAPSRELSEALAMFDLSITPNTHRTPMPTINGLTIDFDLDMPDMGAIRARIEEWLALPEHLLMAEAEHGAELRVRAAAAAEDPLIRAEAKAAAMEYAIASAVLAYAVKHARVRHLRADPEALEAARQQMARERISRAMADFRDALGRR